MKMLNPCKSYHNVRLIVVIMLVITMFYPNLIDAATIHHSKVLDEQSQFMALRDSRNIRISRSTENNNEEDTPKRYCFNTACGWAVYDPNTRIIEYFMKNTCECLDKSYKCVRGIDDLSASAHKYDCRQNTTADDIEFPEDAN